MQYSASPQVHEMAKALFLSKIVKWNYSVDIVNQVKEVCYRIACDYYGESVEILSK